MGSRLKQVAVPRLMARQSGRCAYCRTALTAPLPGRVEPTTRTVDHVTPRALGGRDHLSNLVLACQGCNSSKGEALPLPFIVGRLARA